MDIWIYRLWSGTNTQQHKQTNKTLLNLVFVQIISLTHKKSFWPITWKVLTTKPEQPRQRIQAVPTDALRSSIMLPNLHYQFVLLQNTFNFWNSAHTGRIMDTDSFNGSVNLTILMLPFITSNLARVSYPILYWYSLHQQEVLLGSFILVFDNERFLVAPWEAGSPCLSSALWHQYLLKPV